MGRNNLVLLPTLAVAIHPLEVRDLAGPSLKLLSTRSNMTSTIEILKLHDSSDITPNAPLLLNPTRPIKVKFLLPPMTSLSFTISTQLRTLSRQLSKLP